MELRIIKETIISQILSNFQLTLKIILEFANVNNKINVSRKIIRL